MKKTLLILTAVVIIFAAALFFLSRSLKGLVERQITAATGAVVDIEKLAFNPFRGFTVSGLSLTFSGDSVPQTISEIRFTYSPLSLLKRELRITSLTLKSPRITLAQKPDGTWNITLPPPAPADDARPADITPADSAKRAALPMKITLKQLNIKGIQINAVIPQGRLTIENADFTAVNVFLNSIDDFTGGIILENLHGQAAFDFLPAGISFNFNADANASNEGRSFRFNAAIRENSPELDIPVMALSAEGKAALADKMLEVENFDLRFGGGENFALTASGELRGWDAQAPDFRLNLGIARLNLDEECWICRLAPDLSGVVPNFQHRLRAPLNLSLAGSYNTASRQLKASCALDYAASLERIKVVSPSAALRSMELELGLNCGVQGDSLFLHKLGLDLTARDFSTLLPEFPETLGVNEIDAGLEYGGNEIAAFISLKNLLDAVVEGEASMVLPQNLMNFEPGPSLLQDLRLTVDGLNPEKLNLKEIKGLANAAFELKNRKGGAGFTLKMAARDSLQYIALEAAPLTLPLDTVSLRGNLVMSDSFDSFRVDTLLLEVSRWLFLQCGADYTGDSLFFSLERGDLDITGFRRFSLPATIFPLEVDGHIGLTGWMSTSIRNLPGAAASLQIALLPVDIALDSLEADSVAANISLAAQGTALNITASAAVREARILQLRNRSLKNITLSADGTGDASKLSFESTARLSLPTEGVMIEALGQGIMAEGKPALRFSLKGAFADTFGREILPALVLRGGADLALTCAFDSLLRMKGRVSLRDFNLRTPVMEAEGINGYFPLQQTIDLRDMSLAGAGRQSIPFYREARAHLPYSGEPMNNITARRIKGLGWEMTEVSADALWDESRFLLPHFQLSIFEGNLGGKGRMQVDSLSAGKFSYSISAAAAEINSDLVSQIHSGGGEASRISFNFNFEGRGFDPVNPDFDLQGQAHITKISPRVAENLLLALDPKGEDKGIQSMLTFLRRGWGVKSFSFELSHGFVYSSILTQQPPLKKPLPFMVSRVLPLEKEIRLSRLPLKFFLKGE